MKASCWTLLLETGASRTQYGPNIYCIYIYTWNPKQPVLNGCLAPDNMMHKAYPAKSCRLSAFEKLYIYFFFAKPWSSTESKLVYSYNSIFVGVSTSDFILLGALGLHFIENSGQSKMAMILDHMFLYILGKLPQGCKNCIKSSTTKQQLDANHNAVQIKSSDLNTSTYLNNWNSQACSTANKSPAHALSTTRPWNLVKIPRLRHRCLR